MNRDDIERLHAAFEQLDFAARRLESTRGAKRRSDDDYEHAAKTHRTAKATVDALCIKLGVDPGAPAPLMAVPHPRSTPSDATVP